MSPQALDKIQFERLTNISIVDDELIIRLVPHKATKTLSIIDNGVGMNKDGRQLTMFHFHLHCIA